MTSGLSPNYLSRLMNEGRPRRGYDDEYYYEEQGWYQKAPLEQGRKRLTQAAIHSAPDQTKYANYLKGNQISQLGTSAMSSLVNGPSQATI